MGEEWILSSYPAGNRLSRNKNRILLAKKNYLRISYASIKKDFVKFLIDSELLGT